MIPWHLQHVAGPSGKFNSRCREDTISKSVWENTVVRADREAERMYKIRQLLIKINKDAQKLSYIAPS
jgi:DNA-binding winged helix-turn-helix (wHTH) protein